MVVASQLTQISNITLTTSLVVSGTGMDDPSSSRSMHRDRLDFHHRSSEFTLHEGDEHRRECQCMQYFPIHVTRRGRGRGRVLR